MKLVLKPSFWFILKSRFQKKDFEYEFFFKGKKTLDIGCAAGEFIKQDPKLISGIDANAEVLKPLLAKGWQVQIAQADQLPFTNQEFEAVHCRNVIEHLEVNEAYQLLQEGTRVLREGGIFILASEVVTEKFWDTFGHVKPYPPAAVIKLLRPQSREEFDGLADLEYVGVFYLGDYFKNKLLYLVSAMLGYYLPKWFAREYFLILRKR
jgi:SAM-dependent methyltransferase